MDVEHEHPEELYKIKGFSYIFSNTQQNGTSSFGTGFFFSFSLYVCLIMWIDSRSYGSGMWMWKLLLSCTREMGRRHIIYTLLQFAIILIFFLCFHQFEISFYYVIFYGRRYERKFTFSSVFFFFDFILRCEWLNAFS